MRPLDERRFGYDLIEPSGVRRTQSGSVRVVREAHDRHVWIHVSDVVRIHARDIRDDEVGRIDPIDGDEMVLGKTGFELASKVKVDPTQQDRGHRTGE